MKALTGHRRSVIVASVLALAAATVADAQERQAYSAGGAYYSLSLPGGGTLPPVDATVLGVNVGGPRTSVGCDGINAQNVAGQFLSDMDSIYNYYRKNWSNLALSALIYSNPTMWTLVNNSIKGFRDQFSDLIVTCREVRRMSINTWYDEAAGGTIEQQAMARCLSQTGGSWTCQMDTTIDEYISEGWRDLRDRVRSISDKVPNEQLVEGFSAGSDEASTGQAILSTYPLSELARDVGPSLFADMVISEEGTKKLNREKTLTEQMTEWQDEFSEKLDTVVESYDEDGGVNESVSDLRDASNDHVRVDPTVVFELARLRAVSEGDYLITRDRFARLFALARAEDLVSQYEAAVQNGFSNDGVGTELDEESRKHWENNIQTLRAELEAQKRADRELQQQSELLLSVMRYNRELDELNRVDP